MISVRRRTALPADNTAGNLLSGGVVRTVAPTAVEVAPRFLRVGDGFAATLAVTGYPAEVGPAWLEPLLSWPGRLDLALYIDPIPAPVAASRLRKQQARFESSRRADADRGKLPDPQVDAAADDAADLAQRLARGAAKLFSVGLYLTVHARTQAELVEACCRRSSNSPPGGSCRSRPSLVDAHECPQRDDERHHDAA